MINEAKAWADDFDDTVTQLGHSPLRQRDLAVDLAAQRLRDGMSRGQLDQITKNALGAGNPAGWVVHYGLPNATPTYIPEPTQKRREATAGIAAVVEGAGAAAVQTDKDRRRQAAKIALLEEPA